MIALRLLNIEHISLHFLLSVTQLESVEFELRFSAFISPGVERLYLIKTQVGTLFGILYLQILLS